MADYISLTCPTCSAKLKITDDMSSFACGKCGSEHVVKRESGVISLIPLAESVNWTDIGVEKTESELAIPRLEKEIKQLESVISGIREKLQTEDYIEIPIGFSFYTVLIYSVVSAMGTPWSPSTSLGVGVGAFLVAFIVLVIISERKEAKPKKEIEKRKQEIEKHRIIVSS